MAVFFISYTPADSDWAQWIAWVLEEVGHQARIQAWDFPPGCNFVAGMNKAAIECDKTVAVLSPDYFKSLYATHEWSAAFADSKLLTVRVRDMKVEGLLSPVSYIDLVNLGEAEARERLVNGVAPGRRKPPERPGFPGGPTPHFPGASLLVPDVDGRLSCLDKLPLDEIPDPAPLPAGSRMPHAVNRMFVGRDEDLRALARAVKAGKSTAIGQIAAATGLGGIGKTQLASEFVHRYGQFFEGGAFWMSFAEPAGVPAEVVACGRNLGLHPQFSDLPLERQVQLVRDAWQSPLPRLLVFDNCEEPEPLQTWRPTTGGARVLLTSCRARWEPAFGIYSHSLATLSRAASIELLRRFRPDLPEGDLALGEIAEELGDLPLALHLAGSFLHRYRNVRLGQPDSYLEELRRESLLDHPSLQGASAGYIPTSHDAHVARTFALSYKRLKSEDRVDFLAQRLLAQASYLAPGEPIPRDLLSATLVFEPPFLPLELEDALVRLIDLGLLEEDKEGRVAMHRLVARFASQRCQRPEDRSAVERGLRREVDRLNTRGYPGALLAIQPHLRFVVDAIFDRQDEVTAGLCNELGSYLRSIGDYSAALRYCKRALAIREKVLAPECPKTALSLNNVGSLLQTLGDYPGARPYYERALAIWEKVLGPEHPRTALGLNNMGHLLETLGDFSEARSHYERALAIKEKVLGPMDPSTAISLDNLGLLLRALGDFSAARSYCERALAIKEKVLGPEHPDTSKSLNNLGSILQDLGDLSGARSLYERALAIREKVLGAKHPDTAVASSNVGNVLQALGDFSGARPYYERALAIRERSLGPEHPDTAVSLGNLGSLLEDLGDPSEARSHYERALEILKKQLGPDHPDTKITQRNLEILLKELSQPDPPQE